MSNWTDTVGRQMTNNTPTVPQLQSSLGVSTNQAEAIRKAAGQ